MKQYRIFSDLPFQARVLKRAGFRTVPEIINPKTWHFGYRHPRANPLNGLDWHIACGDGCGVNGTMVFYFYV